MDDNEYNASYIIPPNYTDSGKALGGMVEIRNLIETVFFTLIIGFPEFKLIHCNATIKVVIMLLSLAPIIVASLFGIDGDSLLQFLGHIISYKINKRKLHMRRVGYNYAEKQLKIQKKEDEGFRHFLRKLAEFFS